MADKNLDKIEKKLDKIEDSIQDIRELIEKHREYDDKQYPAVLVQTQEETKEDQELGDGAKTRIATLEFLITGYVKGSEDNIDTARNNLASAIETQLESDITRNNKALDTEVVSLETDAGTLFPYGAISMVVRVIYEHDSATP